MPANSWNDARLAFDASTQMIIQIRDAKIDDLDAIVDFNQRLARETESRHLPDDVLRQGVRSALSSERRLRYWVAVDSGQPERPIGQAAISYEWSDWRNGWIWWLQSVFVDDSRRGRGVFRGLLNAIHEAARNDADVIGLRLYVEHENSRARSVYEKVGFIAAGYDVLELLWGDLTHRARD